MAKTAKGKSAKGKILLMALALSSVAATAQASSFTNWQVAGVSFGDTLNVRKYPANSSQKRAAYPNGKILQMTGRCTGGVDLARIQRLPEWKQKEAARTQWCEVTHSPMDGRRSETGWVYGKYIAPLR